MYSLFKTDSGRWLIFLAFCLLVIEASLYSLVLSTIDLIPYHNFLEGVEGNYKASSLSYISEFSRLIFKIGIFCGLAWVLIFPRTFADHLNIPRLRASLDLALIWIVHLAAYIVLVIIRASQIGAFYKAIDPNGMTLVVGFIISASMMLFTYLLILAPLDFWINYLRKHTGRIAIVLLLVIALTILVMSGYDFNWVAIQYHDSLFQSTVYIATSILDQLGFAVSTNTVLHLVTVNDFSITVAAPCLGYQGIMIALALLTLHFYIYRKNYRFPNILLIYPIVIFSLFVTNSMRISLLLIIGAKASPEIAVHGFHSVAGWLNLVMILGLSLLAANRLPFFAKNATGFVLDLSQDKLRLAPEVLLILISLVSLLVTAKFEWAYPLRVIIVGAVLWRWWLKLGLVFSHKIVLPIVTGVIVFAIWIAMVPVEASRGAEFHQTLTSVPTWLMLLWITFRLLGAVVVVPLAEELAFRGYLFDATGRLLKQTIPSFSFGYSNGLSEPNGLSDSNGFNVNRGGGYAGSVNSGWLQTVLVLAVTSIGFGILHSAWLAGILAGVAFGLVRLYRNNLMDAVIAHGVTNLLLAVYVISTGAWSLW